MIQNMVAKCLIVFTVQIGCSGIAVELPNQMVSNMEMSENVINAGRPALRFPLQLEGLLGESNVNHRVLLGRGNPPTNAVWISQGWFGGRYEVSLRTSISIQQPQVVVARTTNALSGRIWEVSEIEIRGGGNVAAQFSKEWRFDEDKWKSVVANTADWSSIDINIKTNSPVKNFELYKLQSMRPDRVEREKIIKEIRRNPVTPLREWPIK